MNISQKEVYVQQYIVSMTRHDDENSAVRLKFIERTKAFLDAEAADILTRDEARITALTGAE